MRFIVLIFGLVVCSLIISCSYNNNVDYSPIDRVNDLVFNETKYKFTPDFPDFDSNGKVYYFIKVWGFLKYHTDIQKGVDWDIVFLKNYPLLTSLNKNEFNLIILNLVKNIKEPTNKTIKNKQEDYALIDNSWFSDSLYFEKEVSQKIDFIFRNAEYKPNAYIRNNSLGNLVFEEKKYNDNYFPDEDIRVLGLAKYWNIINFFYVYKNYLDEKWDDILINSLDNFIYANNEKSYHKSVQELTSYLNDCHSIVQSKVLDEIVYGRYIPNFRIKVINDTFIVRQIRVQRNEYNKIRVGDIILKINNVNIKKKYNTLTKYLKGSNALSEQRIITPYLLSSRTRNIKLLIYREGKEITVSLNLKDYGLYSKEEQAESRQFEDESITHLITDKIAYVNLQYLFDDNFDITFEEVRSIRNLIIDIRCYPETSTVFNLTNYIIPYRKDFFICTYADIAKPGTIRQHQGYKMGNQTGSDIYKGKVILLVNEYTQSMAEFLVMALQSSSNVVTIGSQTAGSDGNVTKFDFPGKIQATFSGIGIYYPDLTQTQRIGIKIDYKVNQTVAGIQNNRDELLDFAVDLISNDTLNY